MLCKIIRQNKNQSVLDVKIGNKTLLSEENKNKHLDKIIGYENHGKTVLVLIINEEL